MALTLDNFIGFETSGLEEAFSTGGSPSIQSAVVKTGNYALELDNGDSYEIRAVDDGALENRQILGFAFQTTDVTPGGDRLLLVAEDVNLVATEFEIYLLSTGELRIRNYGPTSDEDYDTAGLALQNNTWHYIEVERFGSIAAGVMTLDVDGNQEISVAGKDTLVASTNLRAYTFHGATELFYFDDIYLYSGASSSADFLGPRVEVLGAFQNTEEDATDQGTTLDDGTWADTGDTPGADEGTPAGYTSGALEDGYTICDEGNRAGPAALITGTAKGAKWIHRLERGSGSGTIHAIRFGKNTTVDAVVKTLTASWQNFFWLSINTSYMPNVNTDNFAQGLRKETGGREMYCAEMWAFLLHIAPDPATLDLSDMEFPDQNYYLGPFGT